MTRLREEILSAIGDSETPHYEDLRKIKYREPGFACLRNRPFPYFSQVRAVLNETLRLFPPVSTSDSLKSVDPHFA